MPAYHATHESSGLVVTESDLASSSRLEVGDLWRSKDQSAFESSGGETV